MERMAEWTYYLIYNYHGVSLSAAVFRVLSTTCISKLTPDIYIYIYREREREREREKITGDEQCGFGHNGSTTDQISCICHTAKN